jgi:two-component system response regulator PilR (NtrC family)
MNNSTSAPTALVLVIDDEPDLRTVYELTLLREGYRVESAGDLEEARVHLRDKRFDAVITDMRLPDGLGLELLKELAAEQRMERCVVITAHGSAKNAVEALKAGAFDYLTKPVDLKQFRSVVAAAIQGGQMAGVADTSACPPASGRFVKAPATAGGAATLGKPAATPISPNTSPNGIHNTVLEKLVGDSAPMRIVKARIAKVAGSMAPILIQGESGTGKELVARAVHGCSHRSNGPFVAVNCGAIPENLLEAEFFGARKGAYTGSTQDRLGYFQTAKGGTLFLDEIGDLPLAMQSKLLRAIQERAVRPLGSAQEDVVDVRIVSATHKDLNAGVHAGVFRQDLYYRLNVIEITVPALRERIDDLPALCSALLARICGESDVALPRLTEAGLKQLKAYPFPGNVRELENMLHRAVALGDGGELDFDMAQAPLDVAVPANLQDYLDLQERTILSKVLAEHGFNRTAAAAQLGLSLRQIRYRIARLNIVTPGNDEAIDEP